MAANTVPLDDESENEDPMVIRLVAVAAPILLLVLILYPLIDYSSALVGVSTELLTGAVLLVAAGRIGLHFRRI